MPHSNHSALRVRARTAEVVDYHRAPEKPGKPLHLLIPGGVVALASLGLIFWIAYLTWYQASLEEMEAVAYLVLLVPVYAGAVFLFSYGYELYDIPRAVRLTVILVFISAAALIIVGVLLALLGKGESASADSGSSGSSGGRSSIDIDLGDWEEATSRDVTAPILCSRCGASYVAAAAMPCPKCGATLPMEA